LLRALAEGLPPRDAMTLTGLVLYRGYGVFGGVKGARGGSGGEKRGQAGYVLMQKSSSSSRGAQWGVVLFFASLWQLGLRDMRPDAHRLHPTGARPHLPTLSLLPRPSASPARRQACRPRARRARRQHRQQTNPAQMTRRNINSLDRRPPPQSDASVAPSQHTHDPRARSLCR
jgi:hypothetical protein